MTRTRVLVLSTALSGGGAESVTRLMVERLPDCSCVLFENDAGIAIPEKRIWTIPRCRSKNILVILLVNIWRLFVIQLIKIRVRPIVTISHLEGPNFTNALTCFGGRRVLFVHNRIRQNYQENNISNRLKVVLAKTLYRRADKVAGVSDDVCSDLIRYFNVEREKVLFIPNPIDPVTVYKASERSYGDFKDQFRQERYLINVASLTLQKNHELLLRVFCQLVTGDNRYQDLKLVLLGEGECRHALYDLCAELGLIIFDGGREIPIGSEQVYFLGFEPNPYPLLRHATLLVMTSLWEGLPITLLEGMSLGVPAVISNCSEGIRSVWQAPSRNLRNSSKASCHWTPHGALIDGLNYDVETINTWAMIIGKLLDDQKQRDNCSAANMARSHDYSIEKIMDIWMRKLLAAS